MHVISPRFVTQGETISTLNMDENEYEHVSMHMDTELLLLHVLKQEHMELFCTPKCNASLKGSM